MSSVNLKHRKKERNKFLLSTFSILQLIYKNFNYVSTVWLWLGSTKIKFWAEANLLNWKSNTTQ